MKKPLLLLLSFVSNYLAASPVGNTGSPALLNTGICIPDTCWYNLRLGLLQDQVFSQSYQNANHSRIVKGASFRQLTQLIIATWDIQERLDLQAFLGGGYIRWEWREEGTDVHGYAEHGLFWCAAAKLVIFHIKHTILAGDVRAGGTTPLSCNYRANNDLTGHCKISTFYGQAAVALTQKIHWFYPYLGVIVLQENLSAKQVLNHHVHLQNRHHSGLLAGCSISNGSYFFMNLEGRGWTESAFTMSCEIRF